MNRFEKQLIQDIMQTEVSFQYELYHNCDGCRDTRRRCVEASARSVKRATALLHGRVV